MDFGAPQCDSAYWTFRMEGWGGGGGGGLCGVTKQMTEL